MQTVVAADYAVENDLDDSSRKSNGRGHRYQAQSGKIRRYARLRWTSSHKRRSERTPKQYATSSIRIINSGAIERALNHALGGRVNISNVRSFRESIAEIALSERY